MFITDVGGPSPLWVTPFLELVVPWLCKKPIEQEGEPGIRLASSGLWFPC